MCSVTNGVRRVLRVNPMATDPNSAVMITEASLPNAGQFGWTSRDLSGVKDLAVWVSEAQEYFMANQGKNIDILVEHVKTGLDE